jgi:hypothetical protein
VTDGEDCSISSGGGCSSGTCQSGTCDVNTITFCNCDPSCQTAVCPGCTCSNIADGTPCGSGDYCSNGSCQPGCDINGQIYTAGATNPSNPCQSCQPSVSTTSWSPVTNTTTSTCTFHLGAFSSPGHCCNGTCSLLCDNGTCPGTDCSSGACLCSNGQCPGTCGCDSVECNGRCCPSGYQCVSGVCCPSNMSTHCVGAAGADICCAGTCVTTLLGQECSGSACLAPGTLCTANTTGDCCNGPCPASAICP